MCENFAKQLRRIIVNDKFVFWVDTSARERSLCTPIKWNEWASEWVYASLFVLNSSRMTCVFTSVDWWYGINKSTILHTLIFIQLNWTELRPATAAAAAALSYPKFAYSHVRFRHKIRWHHLSKIQQHELHTVCIVLLFKCVSLIIKNCIVHFVAIVSSK